MVMQVVMWVVMWVVMQVVMAVAPVAEGVGVDGDGRVGGGMVGNQRYKPAGQ